MRFSKEKAVFVLFIFLCCGFVYLFAQDTITDVLQEDEKTEQVESYENKQGANAQVVETKILEEPQRDQISVGKYAYEQLGDEEKIVYDEMLDTILNHTKEIKLSTTDTEQMRRSYSALCKDYGGLFWVEGYVFTKYTKGEELVSLEFSPKYTMTQEQRKDIQSQIDEIVEVWLGGISINDTDYDKAKYVYEKLALNTEYVQNAPDSQNIISVFIRRQTVCQGYACAVQYLLQQLGVHSVIVSGTALGEPHGWNMICLDGEYYYMDATWGNTAYHNKEGAETPFIDYNYMAMTTEEMQMGHVPDTEMELPECTAVSDNYYIKEGYYLDSWEPEKIGALIADAWAGRQVLTLRFSDEILREQAFRYFIEEGHVADYCTGMEKINYIEDSVWKEITLLFAT